MSLKDLKSANLGLFDLFGTTPTFKIQGHKKHYSLCGLFLTFLVSAFVIWALILTSGDLLHRKNPSLVASELPGGAYNETLVITPGEFRVKFGLYDMLYSAPLLDPTYYTVRARLVDMNATDPMNIFTNLDIEVCQSDLKQEDYKYWCLKANQSKVQDLYLNKATFIQIDFVRCRNSTSGGTCQTMDAIDAKLKYTMAQIEYSKWTVDPTDFNNPFKSSFISEQQGILVSLYKLVNIYMKKLNFISDNGWIVEDSKSESIVSLENNMIDIREPGAKTSAFFTYAFYPSGNEMAYTRKYSKIQDVLAQVSGLAGAFIIIIGMLGRPYDEFKMYETVINTMYDIRDKMLQKNFRSKQPGDSTKPQEPIHRLRTFSEDYIPKKASFERMSSINRDERPTNRNSNDSPPDSNRVRRIIDLPKLDKKSSEKYIKRNVSFPQLGDLESQKDYIREEELEVAEENLEMQEIELTKMMNDHILESPELEPNSAPNRFDSVLESERRMLNSRNDDIKLDRLKEKKVIEESVNKEDTFEAKGDKNEMEIEAVLETLENVNPLTPRGILRQTTIQSPSQGYIETDGNLIRQATLTNENRQVQPPPEVPGQELDIGYLEWLISFIRPTKKMKVFQRGMEELMKHLDIITLVRTLAEVDKLKSLLLDNKQKVLYDNLQKPKLYVNWNEYKKQTEAKEEKLWAEAREADKPKLDEAYRSLKSLERQSTLDKRLTSIYEKERGGSMRE